MIENILNFNIPTQPLSHWFTNNTNIVNVLRLDTLHPIISGNKWFKLKYHLQTAIEQNKDTIITYGGAYSNHIVATAFACQAMQLNSIGIIRGEQPTTLSHTLLQAKQYGMQLQFISRADYAKKTIEQPILTNNQYLINEGGLGKLGAKGASEILNHVPNIGEYNYIVAACGTGTMLAGLAANKNQNAQLIGINVLKGNTSSLLQDIKSMLPTNEAVNIQIIEDYCFGGYAKKSTELLHFMNQLWQHENIPSDFVYSGKMFYGLNHLITQQYFKPNAKILAIHCGGLQGNLSLPKGSLLF